MNNFEIVLLGLAGSFAAGSMTAVGAVPVLFNRTMSMRAHDTFLGFAAGVMLAASFFSLIIPGLEVAEELTGSVTLSALVIVVGLAFAAGAMIYVIVHEIIPEIHDRAFANEATAGLTAGLVIMMFLDVTLG